MVNLTDHFNYIWVNETSKVYIRGYINQPGGPYYVDIYSLDSTCLEKNKSVDNKFFESYIRYKREEYET